MRSCSIFSGVLWWLRSTLWAMRLMWVSTTNPIFLWKMFQRITLAVFLPTPAREVRSSMVLGRFPWKFICSCSAHFLRFFDLVL